MADTHIPDRVNGIHPEVAPIFREAGVTSILHAGDISTGWVLEELGRVAPVTAVRGNRDFLARRLKLVEYIQYNGVSIALMHGHGSLVSYLMDKVRFFIEGYRLERYLDLLDSAAGGAKVVVFGHTHHAVIYNHRGKLVINPGSASFGPHQGELPTLGLLHISARGEVSPEIVSLRGWKIRNHTWVKA
jgi:putative phosphoesterase